MHRAKTPFAAGKYALKRISQQYQFFFDETTSCLPSSCSLDCDKTSSVGALRSIVLKVEGAEHCPRNGWKRFRKKSRAAGNGTRPQCRSASVTPSPDKATISGKSGP